MSFFVKFFVLILLYEKFAIVLCENGDNFTYLVVGGYRPTQHTLTKYAVSIRFFEKKPNFGYTHFCGGSILSPKVILTAAHCLWDKGVKYLSSESVHVVAGTQNRLIRTSHTQIVDVDRIIVHSNYKPKEFGTNDVAMLHLKSKLKLDGIHAQAIEITDTEPQSGQICTVIGWGRLFDGGPKAADILYGDLAILDRNKCYREDKDYKIGVLCLSGNEHSGATSSKGDSGGPLICDDKQYGIVSFSTGIEGTKSGYADVWHFREWIINKMKETKLSRSPEKLTNHAASYRVPVTKDVCQIPVIFLSLTYVWIM